MSTVYEITTFIEADSPEEAVNVLAAQPDDFIYLVTGESNASVIVDPVAAPHLTAEIMREAAFEPGARPSAAPRRGPVAG